MTFVVAFAVASQWPFVVAHANVAVQVGAFGIVEGEGRRVSFLIPEEAYP
jgi:hypothetical protein